MSLSDLASLGSFVSGLAVLISLIFLYFQLRQLGQQVKQAERNQQASIRQGRASRSAATFMSAADPGLADAAVKALTGAPDITATQLYQYDRYVSAVLNGHEESFYQNKDGLLTDSAFASVVNTLRRVSRLASFRVQWKRLRTAYGADFVEFVDGLIARSPVERYSLDPASWLKAFAAEMSGPPN